MRLLSFRAERRERFGVALDRGVFDLSARLELESPSLGRLIDDGELERAREFAGSDRIDYSFDDIEFLPPIGRPGKIVCIGVNYGNRHAEYRDDSDTPRYPSVFMRTPESLVGHLQPIMRPPESEQLDYEGEIVLVIGKRGRRISRQAAWSHVAGLSLMNEGSVRDWLRHAKFNVTQG
jgi:2-keto-4-pentenoate hydratase/2-oxohepta-3-ene-1,7-dioic acid hydratase in catechol pathway